MKVFLFSALLISLFSLGFVSAPQSELTWHTNYQEAVKKAQKENKRILLNFTGSDWCGWCIKLDKEVFSQKDFVDYADKNLVCVKLDFPRAKKLPEAEVKQNFELQNKYQIQGYPTIVILDKTEKLLGKTGYKSGGAKAYSEHLEAFK
jgi:protein disulfide-isomerase